MTMHYYAVYNTGTGEIVRSGRSTSARIYDVERSALSGDQALYEGEIDPNTTYLPGGVPTPKLSISETISAQDVKSLAARMLSYTDWYVTRRADTGEDMPANISAYRQAVRDASDAIEAMDPIPVDFRDQKYWPVAP